MLEPTNTRILLVDDDEDDQFLFRQLLQQYIPGCQVSSLYNGEELLEALAQGGDELPGLILLDVNMPRLNGFDALSQLRAEPAYQNLYVVMITTAGRELERHKSLFLGANQFVVKPTSVQQADELMQRLVTRWRAGSQETESFF